MKRVLIILVITFMGLYFSFGQYPQQSWPCDTVFHWGDLNGPNTPVYDTLKCDIYTPMGSFVATWSSSGEFVFSARKNNDSLAKSKYPGIELIFPYDGVSTTRMFNCHGYAWLRVEQGIDRWIGYQNIEKGTYPDIYMTDDSYIEVPIETYPGKVFWDRPGDHSAITTDQPGWVISKWADGVLCKHPIGHSPYGSTNLRYYVKNPCTFETPPINLINQTINTNQTIKDCRINVQNVNVTNGSKLILDATLETTIEGPFEVQLGSELIK
jgi:hypothetical protein